MARSVKNKVRLGTLFLFFLVLISGGVGIYHLVRLKNDATRIIKNNYESLDYCHSMQALLESPDLPPNIKFSRFDSVLRLQEANITEAGEKEATSSIRNIFEKFRSGEATEANKLSIDSAIQKVLQLNMAAIKLKNEKAAATAEKALTYISLIAAIVFMVGLTFSYNFPSVLTTPIAALKEGIEEISRKNYQFRIHMERKDEFGQMADAFNRMGERLEYFESSNLNKIIFEKTRAEAVINSLKDASIGLDKNDIILFANDQALQLLNLQSKGMVGKPLSEVTRKNDLLKYLVEDKSSLPFKIVIDNRENYFTKEVLDIVQEGGGSKVIIVRNITSFKELDAAKTNFIATISHELKTPLASSDFSLKLLEDERIGKLSAEQKELLGNLKSDNQRMLRILSELLNMAQVETGKIQLIISEVDAKSIMDQAIRAVSNTVKEKNISFEKSYPVPAIKVRADIEKTSWVLSNFLSNAIKYSPEASKISVRISALDDQIEFSVRDQGPGIPEEYQSKVFERFFKVPGSKEGGTGLGLAISKEFIEAQGGQIWTKSELGSGSTFGFTLPGVNGINNNAE
jgi:signal transduction histidine kinase